MARVGGSMKTIKGIPIVDCFGTKKYRILKTTVKRKTFGKEKSFRAVEVYNEKLGMWITEPMVEHFAKCPVCGKLIFVRAIFGTTYVATCSDKCMKKLMEKAKELGDLYEAVKFFGVDPFNFSDEEMKRMEEFIEEYHRKEEIGEFKVKRPVVDESDAYYEVVNEMAELINLIIERQNKINETTASLLKLLKKLVEEVKILSKQVNRMLNEKRDEDISYIG